MEQAVAECANISYVGQKSHGEVLCFLRSARVGVLPSICNEVLSLFALEVIFAGKPLVATDTESMSWLKQASDQVYYSRPGEPTSLARAIERALMAPGTPKVHQEMTREAFSEKRFMASLGRVVALLGGNAQGGKA